MWAPRVGPQNDIWGVFQVHTACNTLQICMSKGLDLIINPPCCKSYSNKNRQKNLSCSIYFILFNLISLTDFVNPLKKPISSRYAEGLFQKYLRSDGKTFNVSPFLTSCLIQTTYCGSMYAHCAVKYMLSIADEASRTVCIYYRFVPMHI